MAAKLADLKRYVILKGQVTVIQSELRIMRPRVVEALEAIAEKQVEVAGKVICLTTKQRSVFDMRAAKAKIGKVLKPFFKTKEYSEITILGDVDDDEGDDE
jgi:hypothetical protein